MKVALVHDWLLGMRGGERCLEVFCSMFPDADLYTTFYHPASISAEITQHEVTASALQSLPFVRKYYRYLLPLYPFAARSLSRALSRRAYSSGYDLVISVSHCLAKNVSAPQGLSHVCYCLTPMRYAWDQYDAYFAGRKFEPVIRRVVAPLRSWDVACAPGVDRFMAISDFVRGRIARAYQRESEVVYPPVRTDWITPRDPGDQGKGFLCVSALVPYKNVEIIVRAFNKLRLPLTVLGSGPEEARLRSIAHENIRFVRWVTDSQLASLYKSSKALLFAAEEDFGMIPVEMQAAGRPVICYGRGGVLETVSADVEKPTGVFFADLAVDSVCAAVEDFIVRQEEFAVDNCLEQSKKFSLTRFHSKLIEILGSLGFLETDLRPPGRKAVGVQAF